MLVTMRGIGDRIRRVSTLGRKRGKYTQLGRVLRLQDILRARRFGVSLAELAESLGVTERQVRRDITALEQTGLPIEATSVDGKSGVRLTDPKGGAVRLSVRERYALLAARRVFDVLKGTPFYEDVASIYTKIAASLPETQQGDLDAFGDRFAYVPDGGTKSYEDKEDVLDALMTGVLRRWRVVCRYRSASGSAEREGLLSPYAMLLYKNGLYVLGDRQPLDGPPSAPEPRIYAVERFVAAEHVRGDVFELPAGFSVATTLGGAFGLHHGDATETVEIDFTARARPFVEARRWHPSQRTAPLPGGGLRLSFEVPDPTPVMSWVLQWGPLAEVRAPASLRAELRRELEASLGRYRLGDEDPTSCP
jgi:predicted DNA-binding transcriptional regulator YafY